MQSLDNYVEKKHFLKVARRRFLGSQQTEIIMHKILQAFFYFLQRFPFFFGRDFGRNDHIRVCSV